MARFALYGTLSTIRERCSSCRTSAFVIDGKYACCGRDFAGEVPRKIQRMSIPAQRRSRPTEEARRHILGAQDYRCYYCGHSFGISYRRSGKEYVLRIHWDHMVPWSYSQNNRAYNFVAACNVCNLIKSSKIFETPQEARDYVRYQIKKKGFTFSEEPDLSAMPNDVLAATDKSEILSREVQGSPLDEPSSEGRDLVKQC